MPAEHKIDHKLKIIFTVWHGDADDLELVSTLACYYRDILTQCQEPYDEILDFSEAGRISASSKCIKTLARMSAARDVEGIKTRLAIITGRTFTFGLARMYSTYRDLYSENSKDVRVYMHRSEAMQWISSDRD